MNQDAGGPYPPFGGPSEGEAREQARDEAFRRIMVGSDFTEGEKRLLQWQFRRASGFVTALMEVMARADHDNLDRLALGFPEEAAAMRAWKQGDLSQRFERAGVVL